MRKYNFLVLVESYPCNEKPYAMSYVHSRNIEYLRREIDVSVLSFSAKKSYKYNGVCVYSLNDLTGVENYDCIISHAPNVRNHIRFLLRNISALKKVVFFIHGHEALVVNDYYPEPYSWNMKGSVPSKIFQNFYDVIKLYILKRFVTKYRDKVSIIYVSEWMKREAKKCLNLSQDENLKEYVVNNPANSAFLDSGYNFCQESKLGDFITIRPLDDSKYAVDLVVKLAECNPDLTFDIYGKGQYFNHNNKPNNLFVYDKFIEQNDIPALLDRYIGAVMPTRLDAQGVMMCEMASYGIPLITSKLDICEEMLSDFDNVRLVSNKDFGSVKISMLNLSSSSLNDKFSPDKIVENELEILCNE